MTRNVSYSKNVSVQLFIIIADSFYSNTLSYFICSVYSPFCGGCQEFAPTLNKLANHLSLNVPNMQVARFDITENEIPHINDEELFQVEVTPTLYRVRYTPSFHVEFYKGKHDFDSILRWLTVTSTTDEEAAGKRKVDILRRKKRGRRKRVGGSHIRIP